MPLRIGASSTSYGWALGAADLLAPDAARFEMRAVSTVTAFIPPEVVRAMFASSPGTAAAMWRAARLALRHAPAPGPAERTPRRAQAAGDQGEGDVLQARGHDRAVQLEVQPGHIPRGGARRAHEGQLDCPTEGRLIGPCVVVPGSSSMLPAGTARPEFNKLAARVGMTATGDTVLTPDKMSSRDGDMWRLGITKQRGSQDVDARMQVEELVVVVKIALDPAKEIEKKNAWTAHNRLEQLAKLKGWLPVGFAEEAVEDLTKIDRPRVDG